LGSNISYAKAISKLSKIEQKQFLNICETCHILFQALINTIVKRTEYFFFFKTMPLLFEQFDASLLNKSIFSKKRKKKE